MPTVTSYPRSYYEHKATYTRTDMAGEFVASNASGIQTLMTQNKRLTVNRPDWKIVRALGGDATNAYERTKLAVYGNRIRGWTFGYPTFDPKVVARGKFHGTLVLDPTNYLSVADDAVLRDQALARLKRKIRSQTKEAESLVPIFEIRDLRRTITGAAYLTTKLVHDLLSIKRTRGKSALKYASKAWLTYGFGIKPMIIDAQAISEAIAAYQLRNDRTVRLKGVASKEWFSGTNKQTGLSIFGGNILTDAYLQNRLSYRYDCGFDVKMSAANNYGIDQQLGLDFPSILPALWEATAYSWIVDYFSTMGAYLEDTFTSPPGNTKYVSLTKIRHTSGYIRSTFTPWARYVGDLQQTPGFIEYYSITRTQIPYLPHVALRFKTADEIGFMAVNKLLNLASLLVK